MKKKTVILLILLCAFSKVTTHAQNKVTTPAKQFKIDLNSSKIYWKGPKSIGHKHHGYLTFISGSLTELSKNRYSTADFVIDMKSIVVQDKNTEKEKAETNAMLKGDDFFAVHKHPIAIVHITEIKPTTDAAKYNIIGHLTLKGIKQPIQFLATIKKIGQSITAMADFKIDRNRWGINSKKSKDTFSFVKDKLIADDIPISLRLTFK